MHERVWRTLGAGMVSVSGRVVVHLRGTNLLTEMQKSRGEDAAPNKVLVIDSHARIPA
jgi:hypothetical protein